MIPRMENQMKKTTENYLQTGIVMVHKENELPKTRVPFRVSTRRIIVCGGLYWRPGFWEIPEFVQRP